MTVSDYELISHLDFDYQEIIPCEGLIWIDYDENDEPVNEDERPCDRPAKVHAIRTCCGHIDTLCLECYNESVKRVEGVLCRFCNNPRTNKPYTAVNFI